MVDLLALILHVNQSQAGEGGCVYYLFIYQRSRLNPGGLLRKHSGGRERAKGG